VQEVIDMGLSIGEIAELASVSVRTLHHYDELGLLVPSVRTEAGYRLYCDEDVAALQQVLFFKELGFGLADIARIMHDPTFDRLEALQMQHRMLSDKAAQLALMVEAVDAAIDATEGGVTLDAKDMLEVFGDFDPKQYEAEVEKRWGNTDSYAQSARRTKRYTKEDWQRFKDESEANGGRMIELFDAGVAPSDPRAMDVADEARLLIDRWFYDCSREMHACLGEMYVADPRFKANYEKMREGMAQWFSDAIKANAVRGE
jgi:MerR family transcriptional regulator, thiopeptide resistance regulator